MKIVCINLARRPDRLAHMKEQSRRVGLDFVRLEAVDGLDSSVASSALQAPRMFTGEAISAAAYACLQSHRKAWQFLIDSGDDQLLILEDDLFLSAHLSKCLEQIVIPSDADIVKVETFRERVHLDKQHQWFSESHAICRLRSSHLGCGGYIITDRAARKLLVETSVCGDPVDEVLFNEFLPAFRHLCIYQLFPAVVIQGNRQPVSDDFDISDRDWELSSIIERFQPNTYSSGGKVESLFQRLIRRSFNEIRAVWKRTSYVVVPFD